jgi:hypothetical protein
MLLAWRSTSSTASFGEDERAPNHGEVACSVCGGLPSSRFGSVCMTCGIQPPCRMVGTLEHVGGDLPVMLLGHEWGDLPLKRDRSPGQWSCLCTSRIHRVFPPYGPPDGVHPCCLLLAAVGGARPRGGWRSSVIARLQGFSSCSPAAVPRQWSPRMMTTSLVVGKSESGRGLPPALSFKDVQHPCWGGGQAELVSRLPHGLATRFFLQHLGEKGVHQPYGGGELPPAAWSGCGCPSTVWATVAPCTGRPRPRPFPRRRLHRGVVQDVVLHRDGFHVLGQSCPRSCGEDGSEDLLVRAGAAAIRRCGIGAQVAAVVGAEVVAATAEGVASADETISATCGRTSGSLALMACSRPS